jgi:hypothetical protein
VITTPDDLKSRAKMMVTLTTQDGVMLLPHRCTVYVLSSGRSSRADTAITNLR